MTNEQIQHLAQKWAILNYTPVHRTADTAYIMDVAENSYEAGYNQCLQDIQQQKDNHTQMLKKLEEDADKALANETPESLEKWLNDHAAEYISENE